ncbi:hypothetical protein BZA77DRAFT_319531 [Pyronema omphalodes]|nr:hypothetical protein BZA77DRAFT_319531 [Pyronema omphalodes]
METTEACVNLCMSDDILIPTHTWTTPAVSTGSTTIAVSTAALHNSGGRSDTMSLSFTLMSESSVYYPATYTYSPWQRVSVALTALTDGITKASLEAVDTVAGHRQCAIDTWLGQEQWEDGVRIFNISTDSSYTTLHATEVINTVVDGLSIDLELEPTTDAGMATLNGRYTDQADPPVNTSYAMDVYLNQTREEDGVRMFNLPDIADSVQLNFIEDSPADTSAVFQARPPTRLSGVIDQIRWSLQIIQS